MSLTAPATGRAGLAAGAGEIAASEPRCTECGITLLPPEIGFINYGNGVVLQECDSCLGITN